MGYDRKSYSPLKQINKSNVKRLVPIWNASLMNDLGELAAPTIYNGVMYAINGKWTFAIDVETGRQIWRTPVELEAGDPAQPAINRGAATIYNGKLFRVTIDNHMLALDMKTGKQIWNQKFADAEGGLLRHERADRRQRRPDFRHGRRRIHHARVPRRLGSRNREEVVAPIHHPGAGRARLRNVAQEQRCLEAGRRTDLALRFLRSAARSGVLGNRQCRALRSQASRRRLDSLFTSSVLAIRPKTGEIVCYFQYTPNDVYDVDGTDEHVLADIQVGGQPRKVMIQANKNGFLYVLDRTNCKLIAANPLRESQLGVAYRSRHRPTRPDRALQALSRRRRS